MNPRAIAALGIALAGAVPLGAAWNAAYPDAPPPGMTGGFGEPTCVQCHFEGFQPASGGGLVIEGLPAKYTPGSRYVLTVALDRPDMGRAGFQLAARFVEGPARGRQAGAVRPLADDAMVTELVGVAYVHQTLGGSRLAEPGRARWRVEWKAPSPAQGAVAFHVAGNAANGDESALGDHVYAFEAKVAPARGSASR